MALQDASGSCSRSCRAGPPASSNSTLPLLPVDGETSAEHLGELVESGWVAVVAPGYQITERGQTAYSRLAEVVAANRELATEGLSPQEYDGLVNSLQRIAGNLGWTDE
jgi:hypothetical protein